MLTQRECEERRGEGKDTDKERGPPALGTVSLALISISSLPLQELTCSVFPVVANHLSALCFFLIDAHARIG